MKKFTFTFVLIALFSSGFHTGCKHRYTDEEFIAREQQFDSCFGHDYNTALEGLTDAFDKFLVDNKFCKNSDDLLDGYKKWLGYLLEGKGPDTTWKFRIHELEALLVKMEALHFPEVIEDESFSACVLSLEYPDGWIMKQYREIMPQHTVSPERFAKEFVDSIDRDQFRDPVIRKVVALEYFLGPILHILRPEQMYLIPEK
jgi:hypothetical protein